jgi:hypothetical protein
VWAFLLSVVGVGVTVFGTQTSAFLFDWDGGDALVHRDRIVAGGALSAVRWSGGRGARHRRPPRAGPTLGLVGVMGVTLAAGAVAALVALRGDGEFRR